MKQIITNITKKESNAHNEKEVYFVLDEFGVIMASFRVKMSALKYIAQNGKSFIGKLYFADLDHLDDKIKELKELKERSKR